MKTTFTSKGIAERIKKGVYVVRDYARIEYCYDPSGTPHTRNGAYRWRAIELKTGKQIAYGPTLGYVCDII